LTLESTGYPVYQILLSLTTSLTACITRVRAGLRVRADILGDHVDLKPLFNTYHYLDNDICEYN
jgi:hypothetical protein